MITITYSEHGNPNADRKSRALAKEILNSGNDYVTSTESLIDAFQVMVLKGEASKEDVQFKFKDEIVSLNHLGQISKRPKGFCDARDDLLDELLGLA